ncbi:MAG: LytTR family DNA-binding domain-containing protein [Burkholderiaceae bacterium]
MTALNILIVDDEPLARSRLRTLLGDCTEPRANVGGEAQNATDAMVWLKKTQFDAVLLDIHMPGDDGLALARAIKSLQHQPAIVFITAHAEHAVEAFELTATDYLTKPVRLERLQNSLQKIEQLRQSIRLLEPENGIEKTSDTLIIQERGITERIPLREVLYLKAELKYISVRTALKTHILEGSLNELETRFPNRFLRIHRNALVATQAIRALEKHYDPDEGDGWAVRLSGIDETLMVSRRQLAAVKEVISKD